MLTKSTPCSVRHFEITYLILTHRHERNNVITKRNADTACVNGIFKGAFEV